MGFRIATNVQSLAAQRSLGTQRSAMNHQLEKLSSGERIVRAADDAAGLAISEKLRAEIRSNRQAQRNTQDAVSLVQVAEGGLNEISNILIRMRELSIQSASDTISDRERAFTDREVQALKLEVDRISNTTRFNDVDLLNGTGEELEFQVGTGDDKARNRITYDPQEYNATVDALGIREVSTEKKLSSQENLAKLDEAISRVSSNRAGFGAMQNRLQSTFSNLQVTDENISAANSRIRDADIAMETAELTKRNILTQAGVATLSQANQNGVLALKLI